MLFTGAKGSPRIRAGHQSHLPPHPDPAGQEGERASVHSPGRAWGATPQGIHHAGGG